MDVADGRGPREMDMGMGDGQKKGGNKGRFPANEITGQKINGRDGKYSAYGRKKAEGELGPAENIYNKGNHV